MASNEESNYEQNGNITNNDNKNDNEDYVSQDDISEGTIEDADVHEDNKSTGPRWSTRVAIEVE